MITEECARRITGILTEDPQVTKEDREWIDRAVRIRGDAVSLTDVTIPEKGLRVLGHMIAKGEGKR